ncbi:helix-turn-helix domain-containing protein [Lewinella sp. LCG006]|uniref:helix-turn-helix domain-containing protein n=1 Tax=Lewinella sp. LCG006 TaxID=3231911 RepID=UPI00345F8E79
MADHDEYTKQQLEKLGKRIKALRKQAGYSNYEQFAFQNEINRSQYGRYENGEDLRFSSLLKVLKALDVSLEEFFSEGFEDQSK